MPCCGQSILKPDEGEKLKEEEEKEGPESNNDTTKALAKLAGACEIGHAIVSSHAPNVEMFAEEINACISKRFVDVAATLSALSKSVCAWAHRGLESTVKQTEATGDALLVTCGQARAFAQLSSENSTTTAADQLLRGSGDILSRDSCTDAFAHLAKIEKVWTLMNRMDETMKDLATATDLLDVDLGIHTLPSPLNAHDALNETLATIQLGLRTENCTLQQITPRRNHAGLVDVFSSFALSPGSWEVCVEPAADDSVDVAGNSRVFHAPVPKKLAPLELACQPATFIPIITETLTPHVLKCLDWNNVVVAGGAVTAALLRSKDYGDVDFFFYGLKTSEEAAAKLAHVNDVITTMYEVQSGAWLLKVTRSAYAVTFELQNAKESEMFGYLNRDSVNRVKKFQVILGVHASVENLLGSFDVDCAEFAFDGTRLWGTHRAQTAMVTQCNLADPCVFEAAYPLRLFKYGHRGFCVRLLDDDCFPQPCDGVFSSSLKQTLSMIAENPLAFTHLVHASMYERQEIDNTQAYSEINKRALGWYGSNPGPGKCSGVLGHWHGLAIGPSVDKIAHGCEDCPITSAAVFGKAGFVGELRWSFFKFPCRFF